MVQTGQFIWPACIFALPKSEVTKIGPLPWSWSESIEVITEKKGTSHVAIYFWVANLSEATSDAGMLF